jgi:hypothetical protein
MPQKPAAATIHMRGEITDHFSLISRTANGDSPNATIIQRKNASENEGISPAFARATMLFVESMQATTMKPMIASAADELVEAVSDLLSSRFINSALDSYMISALASKHPFPTQALNLRMAAMRQKRTLRRQILRGCMCPP